MLKNIETEELILPGLLARLNGKMNIVAVINREELMEICRRAGTLNYVEGTAITGLVKDSAGGTWIACTTTVVSAEDNISVELTHEKQSSSGFLCLKPVVGSFELNVPFKKLKELAEENRKDEFIIYFR